MYKIEKIIIGTTFVALCIYADIFCFGISGAGIMLLGTAIVVNI